MQIDKTGMVCDKCDKQAEYDIPTALCKEHWAEWWAEVQPDPKAAYEEAMETLIEKGY